jgi:hypothetical protein
LHLSHFKQRTLPANHSIFRGIGFCSLGTI